MTHQRETFFVTAGTGKVGTAFVQLLASDARQPLVRIATRSPNGEQSRLLQALNPETVQPVLFDENDPASCQRALDGVTKVFLIAPFSGDLPAWHSKVAGFIKDAKSCQHIVKLSVTGARSPKSDPPPGQLPLSHWKGEEAMRQTGIPCTCIRPTIFMQHFLTVPGLYVRGDDRFYLPTGNARVAFLDCRDIAAAAASLLWLGSAERSAYHGKSFELTGPSAPTGAEISDILSWVSGRRIEHIDGADAFSEHAKKVGASDVVKNVYKEAAGGWFSKVEHEPFSVLTGRTPSSFAKFAQDNAAFFAPKTGD
jgi:uncharacterized protein YbjT (DUF2867 family)